MSLITDAGDASRLLKYLADAIPLGEHPNPHDVWVNVRLDVVRESIDHIEWLEKGGEEWRQIAVKAQGEARRLSATSRIAIDHLQAVLNKARTHAEQQAADTAARDWLISIGSEP